MTTPPDAGALEGLEREVFRGLLAALPEVDRTGVGLALDDLPCGTLLTLGCVPVVPDFNRTLAFGLQAPVTPDDLDDLLALARTRGLERVMVGVVPGTPAGTLREALVGRDAQPARGWAQVWRETAAPPAPPDGSPEVRTVAPGEEELFTDTMMRAFGMPQVLRPMVAALPEMGDRWTAYLAWMDGRPVACGTLYVSGDLAWLGNGATLPECRRHGAQAALIARRVADAAEAGAVLACSQVAEELPDRPNPSEHNMRRAGFHTAYVRQHWHVPTGGPPA